MFSIAEGKMMVVISAMTDLNIKPPIMAYCAAGYTQ